MKIRAAVLHEPDTPFQITELDLDPPRAREVRVRTAAAGVCHSDWSLRTGATQHPLPVVVGHEGSGIVEAVGEGVERVKPGDHVILNWAPNCGACFYCLNNRPSLCGTYTEPIWAGGLMDGTPRFSRGGKPVFHYSALGCFAEATVVPEESCIPLSKEVPLTVGALIGCAVTTGVGAVLNTARVRPGSSLAVFGLGGVGLSILLGARLAGAGQVFGIDRVPEKLAMAKSFGATEGLPSGADVAEAIRARTEGRGADYAFDATGIPQIQEQCLEVVRPGGTVVLAGLSPMGSQTTFPGAILTRQEKTVMGSYYGTANPSRDFPLYAELYRAGKLDLESLISKIYSLDQVNEAFEDMLAGRQARGLVAFPSP
ncbi:MAG: Zn-dependent alcohol dehydrogenase [Planctomycetota bacterium]|jgi:S-(hydroxymethyl)glutathione dehydrogenase/alcohol dehydrogenase